MNNTEPIVDLYINESADFAKPILNYLRELVRKTCPEAEEKIKWSFPHFDYKGSTLCSMASFKEHCAFGFWKASLMKDPEKLFENGKTAMGQLGRIKSIKDLPSIRFLFQELKKQ